MNTISISSLAEIIKSLEQYDRSFVVFATKPWTFDSSAIVCEIVNDDDDNLLEINGMYYFLEIYIINEVIDVWKDWYENENPTLKNKIQAVIFYAENDAYLPPDEALEA